MIDKETLTRIFRKMCYSRYFELEIVEAHKAKLITCPIYLSIGQEAIPATLSELTNGFTIFAQHRAHGVYVCSAKMPFKLIDELLGLSTGCNGGNGGSNMLQDNDIPMIGHHGLVGENVPLAVGYALGSSKNTLCYFGDGAVEEDYVMASMGFAATHKLPILFICTDNNLAVLTETKVRRSWEAVKVTSAYGLYSCDIYDTPEIIYEKTIEALQFLPAFLNIRTCRHYWHVGSGQDGEPEWDSLYKLKFELKKKNIDADRIENEEREKVVLLWQERLQKLSKK